jgi:hypothetical protein
MLVVMATYKVTSDRFSGKKLNDLVTADELNGLDVDALLSAGHLELVRTKPTEKTTKESEK